MNWFERSVMALAATGFASMNPAHAEDAKPTPQSEGVEVPARAPPEVATKSVASALTVRYEGDCVQAPEVAARVERWLRTDRVDRRLSIVVEGGETPRGKALSFVVFSDGEMVAVRRFGALTANCASVLDVLSFSIAVSIDSSVSERAVAGDAAPEGSPEPSRKAPPAELPKARAVAPEGALMKPRVNSSGDAGTSDAVAKRKGALTAAAFSSRNLLPGAALGAEVTARVRLDGGLSPGLGFLATSPNRFSVGKAAASGALFAGRADLEKTWELGPIEAGAATGFLFGSAQVAGLELVRAKSATFFWSAAEARLLLELPLASHFAFHAAGGGSLALTRPVLEVATADGTLGASQMFPALSVSASLGVTAILR